MKQQTSLVSLLCGTLEIIQKTDIIEDILFLGKAFQWLIILKVLPVKYCRQLFFR